jgi:UDP-GlcNAc:undecaprenyl-phosphate GlcNAc-1-phosphate transferase
VPITLFWFVGAINAFNLLDGIDGLASSVGLILSLALAAMAWYLGHHAEALIALALAGSLLAFLIFNFPPASIFLGDAGSMLIGLLLGILAIRSSLKGPATVALAAPVAILAIPILDTGMAILRRRLTGRSIYETDRGHLHHCLMQRGFSGRTTLLWIVSLCVITAAGALLGVVQQSDALAVGTVVLVVCTLAVTGMFGLSECQLLGQRMKNFSTSLVSRPGTWPPQFIPRGTQLHGDQEWDELWQMLVEYAERFDLTSVWLNVNVPAVHEEYHAHWQRKGADEWQMWQVQIPLIHQGVTIGKLGLAGRGVSDAQLSWMSELIDGLNPFQTLLRDLLDQLLATPEQSAELPGEAPSAQPTSPASAAAS